jgi:Bacterial SH3 domain
MTIRDLTEAPSQQDRFSESSLEHPLDSWAPPLAPTGPFAPGAGPDSLGPVTRDQHAFPEDGDFSETRTSFGSRRKLIIAIAIVAALTSALGYFFWPSASEKTATQAAEPQAVEPAPSAQSSPLVQVQTEVSPAPAPAPSPAPAAAPPWPVVSASSQVAAATPAGTTAAGQTASQNRTVLILQRPGVNIRSTPSTTGTAVGTAPKGTRFEVTNREGDWVQVERGRLKGWIKSQFLASDEPR